jgi:hypothetical protein
VRKSLVTFWLGVVVGLLLPIGFLRVTALLTHEDWKMHRAFAAITPDMPRQEVVRLMGAEGSRSDKFHLGQFAGFEFQYAVASRVGAAYFLSWRTGVDTVFTIAFDQNDKAIYKASGGT